MTQTTTAIFENGTLRPTKPLVGIPEQSLVSIRVETVGAPSREKQLEMLRTVPVDEQFAADIEAGRTRKWPASNSGE